MSINVLPDIQKSPSGKSGFDMDTDEEIDEVISMLEEAKGLITEYKKEFWLELGLPAPDTERRSVLQRIHRAWLGITSAPTHTPQT